MNRRSTFVQIDRYNSLANRAGWIVLMGILAAEMLATAILLILIVTR